MSKHFASCQCGQLRVTCDDDADRVSMCHCIDCQRRTGAPFAANSRFRRELVHVEGQATRYSRPTDSGNEVHSYFCPVCGSTVYWELTGFPDVIGVANGMFADPAYAAPKIAVWEQTRHPWTDHIAGVAMEHHPKAP